MEHSPGAATRIGHPMIDTVRRSMLGRDDAYGGFDADAARAAALGAMTELEVCLGLGAHTHYFEPDQATVAWLIDVVVAR